MADAVIAWVALRFVFYNLRVGRPQRRVRLELWVIARVLRPKVLAGCEGIGYDLRAIRGYTLIRDRSSDPRDNVFMYVRSRRRIARIRWHDLRETWLRVKHPGVHPPRSFVEAVVERVRVIVGHQAQHPSTTPHRDTGASQVEGAELVRDRLDPQRRPSWQRKTAEQRDRAERQPGIALLDWNDGAGGPWPTAADVAKAVDGQVVGSRIDRAVVRGEVRVKRWRYTKTLPWLGKLFTLLTDHPWGAFILDIEVPREWWPRR